MPSDITMKKKNYIGDEIIVEKEEQAEETHREGPSTQEQQPAKQSLSKAA